MAWRDNPSASDALPAGGRNADPHKNDEFERIAPTAVSARPETTRSLSQVLFSYLPDQTADLSGGVWLVTGWDDVKFIAVDDLVVRREIARAAYPWTTA